MPTVHVLVSRWMVSQYVVMHALCLTTPPIRLGPIYHITPPHVLLVRLRVGRGSWSHWSSVSSRGSGTYPLGISAVNGGGSQVRKLTPSCSLINSWM